jgi:hypothetical protein
VNMSHDEWLLHQNIERSLDLIDYIERRLYTQDKDTFDPILSSLVDLMKYLSNKLGEFEHDQSKRGA